MPGRPYRAARFFNSEHAQPTRPTPSLSFIARPTANTSVFHRTKGLRHDHRHARQCPKPRLAGLRLDSRLPRTGPIGCGVHFFEYSARQVVCIRIGSVNQHLQAPLYCVLEQTSWSRGPNMGFRGASAGINSFRVPMLQNCGGADSTTMQKTPLFARRRRG